MPKITDQKTICSMVIASALTFTLKNFGEFARELELDESELMDMHMNLVHVTRSSVNYATHLVSENLASEVLEFIRERGTENGI